MERYSVSLRRDTPYLYFVGNFTLAKKGTKSVAMETGNNKRYITATFGISLNNSFLPIQSICAGKIEQDFSRFKFPDECSLNVNPTHCSNSTESVKLTDESIPPYLKNQRQNLSLLPNHKGLLIMDVFTDQMTDNVHTAPNENHICVVNLHANMVMQRN